MEGVVGSRSQGTLERTSPGAVPSTEAVDAAFGLVDLCVGYRTDGADCIFFGTLDIVWFTLVAAQLYASHAPPMTRFGGQRMQSAYINHFCPFGRQAANLLRFSLAFVLLVRRMMAETVLWRHQPHGQSQVVGSTLKLERFFSRKEETKEGYRAPRPLEVRKLFFLYTRSIQNVE